jgi:hypothetical protein
VSYEAALREERIAREGKRVPTRDWRQWYMRNDRDAPTPVDPERLPHLLYAVWAWWQFNSAENLTNVYNECSRYWGSDCPPWMLD